MQPMTDKELITRYIEVSPYHPGKADVRIAGYGVPVWALIGHYFAVERDAQRVAQDYEVPIEAVWAALAYYECCKDVIDARLEANVS